MSRKSASYVPVAVRIWRYVLRDTTARGRFVLAALAVFAILGADTRLSQAYALFALAAGSICVAVVSVLARRPRIRLICDLPERATAGVTLTVRVRIESREASGPLLVGFPHYPFRQANVAVTPQDARIAVGPRKDAEVQFECRPARRGRYELPGPSARRLDPFALVVGRGVRAPGRAVYVHPRYFHMEDFEVPLGRRLQPGGVPLSSSTGDAVEFVGTREYRAGDPMRMIHWRSWARTGTPVVKEFQEEYFSRLALVLDTYVSTKRGNASSGFEAAVSVLASLADLFSRTEAIVDVFAAGPDLYEVSAGRSLAYLENILDVLACLETCPDPPFETVGPALTEHLQRTTSVVAVLLDWDEACSRFLTRVREMGIAIRTIIVRTTATTLDWRPAAEEMAIEWISPEVVEQRLADG